jgi:hypothetical protein
MLKVAGGNSIAAPGVGKNSCEGASEAKVMLPMCFPDEFFWEAVRAEVY